ncbi:MAG: hypothetical protein J7L53_03810 [Deltaproteobacteria bacterium]|nr:hypothetical protein [Deltaproteobacteria bacterium]
MEQQDLKKRCIYPVLQVFLVMALSWIVYNLAWHLENHALHRILAFISGTLLFLSVTFGTMFIYSAAYFMGASLKERVIASLVNPFIWCTKECIRLLISYSFFECFYYYLNPLNIWLLCGTFAQMGLAELLCRWMRKAKGEDIRVFSPYAATVLFVSLFLVISLYAWGEGENAYVIFLEGYRVFFGAGTGIQVPM